MKANINDANVMEETKQLYSKKQAAEEFGVSYRTIERWYNNNYISYVRVGGRVFIPYSEIYRIRDQFINGIPNGSQMESQTRTIRDIQQRHQSFCYAVRQ